MSLISIYTALFIFQFLGPIYHLSPTDISFILSQLLASVKSQDTSYVLPALDPDIYIDPDWIKGNPETLSTLGGIFQILLCHTGVPYM